MTSKLDHALALAADGFWLFPLRAGSKLPAHKGWQAEATRDPATLTAWFTDDSRFNVGIFTGRFRDDQALLVVDVDVKEGKRGDRTLFDLELQGFDLPDTRVHSTASGGEHILLSVGTAVRQGANVLGPGVDVRSRGGLIVGPGSEIKGRHYTVSRDAGVAPAPEWLIQRCGRGAVRAVDRQSSALPVQVDQPRALLRAVEYLQRDAPLAAEGDAGDQTTYRVACRVKDFGLSQNDCLWQMAAHWSPRCSPPWATDELAEKVRNAYAYGLEQPGASAPEAQFKPVEPDATPLDQIDHPFDELNKNYAFAIVGAGAQILWETTDAKKFPKTKYLSINDFHAMLAPYEMAVGKKTVAISKEWMRWKGRRSYDGLVFSPERAVSERFYNLWRGFAVEPWPAGEPVTADAQWAVDAWLEHLRENVCQGDATVAAWLLGYFAHLIQRPWEKPLVAVVLKGLKGTGKNALVERFGALLGRHCMVTAKRRHLIGNFNGHLENCLLFVLDEAFWSGDKESEGILKDLVTGATHDVEHKGKEKFEVDNLTRIVILGNEDWLVPASHDERRYAVLQMGTGRQKDLDFFEQMKVKMEAGGYRLLLRTLQDPALLRSDLNRAPETQGLLDQKHSSLSHVHQWWHQCLLDGRVAASDFGGDWPGSCERERLRASFRRYAGERNIKGWLPDEGQFGKQLKKCCPALGDRRTRDGYFYKVPSLAEARAAWDQFLGQPAEWGE